MQLIVSVKHFIKQTPNQIKFGVHIPEQIIYDYDEDFIFSYDMKTLSIGTWKKECAPEDVADSIKSYFHGTNYIIADIQKLLD